MITIFTYTQSIKKGNIMPKVTIEYTDNINKNDLKLPAMIDEMHTKFGACDTMTLNAFPLLPTKQLTIPYAIEKQTMQHLRFLLHIYLGALMNNNRHLPTHA